MASPQEGYPAQDGYGQPGQQHEQGYDPADSAPTPEAHGAASAAAGGRKKRAYAGQAYEFGAGTNSALGGQQQGGAQVGAGAYGQQPQLQQQPAYDAGGYGQPQPPAAQGYVPPDPVAVGGYQPPGAGYPAPANIGQLNQPMGQMSMADKPAAQQPMQRGTQLNQLYPTDLLNQPLNVAELDFPPPPVVLPPNVSYICEVFWV